MDDVVHITWLVRQCLDDASRDDDKHEVWQTLPTIAGIVISRQLPDPLALRPIHKLRTVGVVPARIDAVFEMIVRPDLARLWDPLQRKGKIVAWHGDRGDGVEHGVTHAVYGIDLPGISSIFHLRDVLTRIVLIRLPKNGPCVIYINSCPDGTPGDPGPRPNMVRAHVSPSGWVLVPQRDAAGRRTTVVSAIIQTDPGGAVPPFVAQAFTLPITLYINRIAAALARMSPQEVEGIVREKKRDFKH